MNLFYKILEVIGLGFIFGTKAIPSDKIREDRHDEKKELREQDANQELINDDFRYLKRRTEIDVWDYVRNVHAKMLPEEMVLHHKILQARVHQYRYDRPILYKKWIKENPKQ